MEQPQEQGRTALPFEFTGNGFEYFKIWIVNVCLSIVTLGIYSAWAKVRNHQYFYGNTILSGSSFAYLANPIAILKGRLIAFFVFIIYLLISRYYPVESIIFSLLFAILLPWVIVRALTFRARYTSYRNIRFNFKGSYGGALMNFILLPFATLFTLGLLYPYVIQQQTLYILGNHSYGASQFSFSAGAGPFYKVFLMIILIGIGLAIFMGILSAIFIPLAGGGSDLKTAIENEDYSVLTIIGAIYLFTLVFYLYIGAYYIASVTNIIFNNAGIEEHGFTSNLATNDMFMLYLTNTLAILATVGLFIPWAKVRMARYRAGRLKFLAAESLDKFIADESGKVSAMGEEIGEVFDIDIGL